MLLSLVLSIACMLLNVSKLRESVRELSDRLATNDSELASRTKTVNSITLTVVVLSMSFIVLSLPLTVIIVVDDVHLRSAVLSDLHNFVLLLVMKSVCYFFCYMSFSVNFYLYCLTGEKFRDELKHFLWGLCQYVKFAQESHNTAKCDP